jgi:transposase
MRRFVYWSWPAFVDTSALSREEEFTMRKSHKAYPREFKDRLVEMVRAGRTPEELAEKFEPTPQSIRNWVVQAERDAGRRSEGLSTDERAELRRLRRENKVLREEREILKKAAAWFARETDSIPPKDSGS